MLFPTAHAAVRTELEHWLQDLKIRPHAVASFDDSALLKVFGSTGAGVFAAPTAIESEVNRQYGVRPIGRVPEVRERFYAVSIERRISHPAVVAISRGARDQLFVEEGNPSRRSSVSTGGERTITPVACGPASTQRPDALCRVGLRDHAESVRGRSNRVADRGRARSSAPSPFRDCIGFR